MDKPFKIGDIVAVEEKGLPYRWVGEVLKFFQLGDGFYEIEVFSNEDGMSWTRMDTVVELVHRKQSSRKLK